jgi:hypothetical protein
MWLCWVKHFVDNQIAFSQKLCQPHRERGHVRALWSKDLLDKHQLDLNNQKPNQPSARSRLTKVNAALIDARPGRTAEVQQGELKTSTIWAAKKGVWPMGTLWFLMRTSSANEQLGNAQAMKHKNWIELKHPLASGREMIQYLGKTCGIMYNWISNDIKGYKWI